ncbi:BYPASS-related protein [Artemisia annua]|uniref:BYPASS-related protein n=1 Tax=Artemisia annua TaxID=35608 RepID=A0A2U1PI63_ARTAN|nr:BYPASS-related protein [Artemisia annua]
MPTTSGYSMPFGTFRRSIMGVGNDHNQVHSMDVNGGDSSTGYHCELGSFEHQVFRRFRALSASSGDELLSLDWVTKLLDAFIACQEDFKDVLSKNEVDLAKPPLDKFVTEFFDRSIRALDICNAIRDGIEKIRLWHKHLEIVSNAFESKSRNVIVEGQFRRAKKALTDLAIVMLDDNKESASMFSHRNRSFGRPNKGKEHKQKSGHSRSLSWSVPNSWSACKQLQLIANGLIPPKSHEISATNGLANVVYTMGFVLMFVLWALVAAIPCQDRSLQVQFTVPRQFSWGTPLNLLHIRIMDESKKRERKNSVGLLKEIYQMEQSIHVITDLVDSVNKFPLSEEQKEEVQTGVKEMSHVCNTFKNGLDPLERQLREVFLKIMSCRTEGLEILGRAQS